MDVSGSMAPYADALLGTRLGEPLLEFLDHWG